MVVPFIGYHSGCFVTTLVVAVQAASKETSDANRCSVMWFNFLMCVGESGLSWDTTSSCVLERMQCKAEEGTLKLLTTQNSVQTTLSHVLGKKNQNMHLKEGVHPIGISWKNKILLHQML